MQIYTNLSAVYRIWISSLIGIVVGMIGGVIRIGWEVLFPLVLRENLGEIAQIMMSFIHITPEILQMRYVLDNGYEWHILYLLWQFCFSIFFAMLYVILVEFYVKLKFAFGILYGCMIWILCYMLFLPLFGFVESLENQNISYFIASLCECILWMWIIELSRRDLRNRITQERDPL
ncbi:DUF1440 domain-containing protein [Helicobacter didelphidarum]|uniref:DUF1440 domain-containing protein n=1 Tax=Helicobacter didelphidarum TaxID=2040648 RepID=A0A3D8IQZ9_9HELI|nr:DUF1440 domain-containing protein [Helicobacter didelphidarum]RDU67622.1 DUF1440 domain-containing protein [Helicobacter didelphidarum]